MSDYISKTLLIKSGLAATSMVTPLIALFHGRPQLPSFLAVVASVAILLSMSQECVALVLIRKRLFMHIQHMLFCVICNLFCLNYVFIQAPILPLMSSFVTAKKSRSYGQVFSIFNLAAAGMTIKLLSF